ncbi:MAG: pimeloyl-ACP methyl ester carboxylesterase [Halioglobus sp.]|jgi:pimeloyl-ACP methyl ester carboxylesterase
MNKKITDYTINVSDDDIADLKRRLSQTRWPDQIPGTDWRYGAKTDYIESLCEYWANDYDWRKHESELNRYPQFITEIDGHDIHFVHVKSAHENATPLLISHGWPGTVVEFLKVIAPLVDPEAHGGKADDAFHVICPSLPGYGFSSTTHREQIDTLTMAEMFAELMSRLGYEKYIAQGGDWGAIITSNIGVVDADHLYGIHLNMPFGYPMTADPHEGLSAAEIEGLASVAHFDAQETGYQKIQGTKPQTLGVGLNDSPAGLCAWITEKFYSWMDCDGDIESVLDRDALLTNISVYWFTQSICSSTRLYYEVTQNPRLKFLEQPVTVPTGVARYPKEIMLFPRKWCDNVYSNIVQWTAFEKGGHFAAMERPEEFVNELRGFAAKVVS